MSRAGPLAGLVATAMGLSGCYDLGVYRCRGEDGCEGGTCEPSGYCSYPDQACASGRRYSELAEAELARACVDEDVAGSDSGSSTTGSTSGPPTAECGNGRVEAPEACDDGNQAAGDGCNPDCTEGGAVRWSIALAGNAGGDDVAWAIVTLGSGDVVVGGLEAGGDSNDAILTRRGADDGSEVWTWYRRGPGEDRIEALATNVVGDVIAAGIETSTAMGGGSAWIGVFSSAGALDFEHRPGGEIVLGATDNAAGFVVAGYASEGDGDGFAAAYNEDSTVTNWRVTSGIAGDDRAAAIDGLQGERFVIFGQSETEAVAWSTDTQQSTLVATFGPGQTQDGAVDAVTGDMFVAGYETTAFAHDAWLTRRGPDGTEQWTARERSVELEVDEEFEAVRLDAAGNVVAAGFRTGDDKDAWIRKYDPAGALIWSREIEEPGASVARALAIDGEGNVVVAGEREGPDGSADLWVAKLAP